MNYRNKTSDWTIEQRLWGTAVRDGDCLIWRPDSPGYRYGMMRYNGELWGTHRLAYTLVNGPIPRGLYVCHKCDHKRCIEPNHLFLGTPADNAIDGHKKGRYPTGDKHPTRVHPECMRRGKEHPAAKLTERKVRNIRSLSKSGISGKDLAAKYNVSTSQVNRIIHRNTWKHI